MSPIRRYRQLNYVGPICGAHLQKNKNKQAYSLVGGPTKTRAHPLPAGQYAHKRLLHAQSIVRSCILQHNVRTTTATRRLGLYSGDI